MGVSRRSWRRCQHGHGSGEKGNGGARGQWSYLAASVAVTAHTCGMTALAGIENTAVYVSRSLDLQCPWVKTK